MLKNNKKKTEFKRLKLKSYTFIKKFWSIINK